MFVNLFGTRRFTGWHMLGLLLLFFGTTIAVNGVMATIAVRTWTGLVVKDDFGASQHYNEKIEEMRRQAALGWRGELDYGNGSASFHLKDASAAPITDATVVLKIGRPTHEGSDLTVTLNAGERGYGAALKLDRGIWNAEIDVIGAHGEHYQQRVRLYVRK